MGVTEIQVRIPRDNALPEDDVINVWHVGHDAAQLVAADQDLVADALEAFYSVDTAAAAGAVGSWFANYMHLAGAEMRFYNVADDSPRLPYYTTQRNMDVTRQGANDLPGEVAVALSYRGEFITGENPARRRGRIFLGCLNVDVLANVAGAKVEVADEFRTAITEAAVRLQNALGVIDFGVYSRGIGTLSGPKPSTTPTATEDWAPFFTPATRAWVDNALDTQRRRGAGPTERTAVNLF